MLHNHQKYVFVSIDLQKLIKLSTKVWLMVKILNVKKINSIVKHIVYIFKKKSRSNVKEKRYSKTIPKQSEFLENFSADFSFILYYTFLVISFYTTHNKSALDKFSPQRKCVCVFFPELFSSFSTVHSAACFFLIFFEKFIALRAQ